jgi:hypothetical protein
MNELLQSKVLGPEIFLRQACVGQRMLRGGAKLFVEVAPSRVDKASPTQAQDGTKTDGTQFTRNNGTVELPGVGD